jgi:hypothetical protein
MRGMKREMDARGEAGVRNPDEYYYIGEGEARTPAHALHPKTRKHTRT